MIQNADPRSVPKTLDVVANVNIRVRNSSGEMVVLKKGAVMEGVPSDRAMYMNTCGRVRAFKPGTIPAGLRPKPVVKRKAAAETKADA